MTTEAPGAVGADRLSPAEVARVELAAWVVILGALAVFLTLVVGGPWLAIRTVRTATESPPASVTVRKGDVRLSRARESGSLAEGSSASAAEGTTLQPLGAGGSSAFVRFFDGSTAMLERFGSLSLLEMRRPRFGRDGDGRSIRLLLEPSPGGTAVLRLGTTFSGYRGYGPLEFRVETPVADVELAPETDAVLRLDPDELQILVIEGRAEVRGTAAVVARPPDPAEPAADPDRSGEDQPGVVVRAGARTSVRRGNLPEMPSAEPSELLTNGDFDLPPSPENGWQPLPAAVPLPNPPAGVHQVTEDGRTILRLVREDSGGAPADLVYRHTIEGGFELEDVSQLSVEAVLRIDAQSLPGGGDRGEEFPLLIILTFADSDGDEFQWRVGFYAVAPDPESEAFAGAVIDPRRDKAAPLGEWVTFESGNLLDPARTGDLGATTINGFPAVLKRIEVKASGHDFDSSIDRLSLLWK